MAKAAKIDLGKEHSFLRHWSKGKPISSTPGSEWRRCGKWMTRVPTSVVEALIAKGYATGTADCFTMKKEAP